MRSTSNSTDSLEDLALSSKAGSDHQPQGDTVGRLPTDASWNFNDAISSVSKVLWSGWSGIFGGAYLLENSSNSSHGAQEALSEPTGFTCTQKLSWGVMQTVVMAVMSQTLVEFTCPEKSLEAAAVLAAAVPLSIELIKFAFNLSGALKKELDVFDPSVNAVQVIVLLALALALYYSHSGKNFSPLGYNSVIIVPGICLKLLMNYFANSPHSEISANDFEANQPLLTTTAENTSANTHAGKWYNHIAMHGLARLPLLFSATNAGGQFFAGMQIPLAEGIEAAGLTNFSGIVAFSVLFNEIIGSHLFKWSGQFKEVHPNPVSRTLNMMGLAIILQMTNVLKGADLGTFVAAFAIGFFTDLLVQESGLGSVIDRAVGKVVSSLQAKCCQWQPADTTASTTRHSRMNVAVV